MRREIIEPLGGGDYPRRRFRRERERRRGSRTGLDGSVEIFPGRSGMIIDIGTGGLAIESFHGLRVGGRYLLRCGRTSATAVVRWSRLARTQNRGSGEVAPVYRSGFEVLSR